MLFLIAACSDTPAPSDPRGTTSPDASRSEDAGMPAPDASRPAHDAAVHDAAEPSDRACPADPSGLDCLYALWDDVKARCEAEDVDALEESLLMRHGSLPLWHHGRALFVTFDAPAFVAGSFDEWVADRHEVAAVCGREDLFVAEVAIPSGHHAYKLVRGDRWFLDPESFAFAYDAYDGNPDGKNSVLNTYDSGLGHLVRPDVEACSEPLMSCRPLTVYLPAGYGAPDNATRRYPTLFMHDGQNVFDDAACCYGNGGWQINRTLDAEIADGSIEPVIVVAADHGGDRRTAEYALSNAEGGLREAFIAFQVNVVQKTADELFRLDRDRWFIAGSSFGALVSFHTLFTHPDLYQGAALLSGAWYPGEDTMTTAKDVLARTGSVHRALYLDHGGTMQAGGDGYSESIEMRDLLIDAGYVREDSPACHFGSDVLCYHHENGAEHNELAWRERTPRFLRFFFGHD